MTTREFRGSYSGNGFVCDPTAQLCLPVQYVYEEWQKCAGSPHPQLSRVPTFVDIRGSLRTENVSALLRWFNEQRKLVLKTETEQFNIYLRTPRAFIVTA
jgi:hypothetical protein